MGSWNRFASAAGDARFISLLGGLVLLLALLRLVLLEGSVSSSSVAAMDLVLALPGVVLLYGGYWVQRTSLRRDVYPVIVTRTLAGIAVMFGFVGLLAISTGLNRPVFTPLAGVALGGLGGFAIGLNEARAVSRAHEAERHRDELRRERDLRDRIFETSPVGIVVVDTDGSITMANDRAARITGLTEATLRERDRARDPLFRATDDDGDPIEEGIAEAILRTEEARYDVEQRFTRADGERVWLSVNAAPLYDSAGNATGVVVAFEDVTEQKRLEAELKETIDRLEESNERLEQFAYAASHDLQEPLRMVSSYLRLLENRYGDALDDDGLEFLDFAVDGADRMRAMIDSLLEYSRITRGDPPEPTDVGAVLEDVLADLQLRLEETDATVTVDDLPTVTADPDQLGHVFRHLLTNALEYSGDDPPRIRVGAERADGAWRFSVADNGIGIDPAYQNRIFDVFEQLHAGRDATERGAGGIGLAMCERIVERHGGEIWVESEPGEGSTFYFTVPAGQDGRAESVREERPRGRGI